MAVTAVTATPQNSTLRDLIEQQDIQYLLPGEKEEPDSAPITPAPTPAPQSKPAPKLPEQAPHWEFLIMVAWMGAFAGGGYSVSQFLPEKKIERPMTSSGSEDSDGTDLIREVLDRSMAGSNELASQGLLRDAMHKLLLDLLDVIKKRYLAEFTDSLTTREILRSIELPTGVRSALSGMIVDVERCWFGSDVPHLDDYVRCRAHFESVWQELIGRVG